MTARIRVNFFTGVLLLSFFFVCGCDEQAMTPVITGRSRNTYIRRSPRVKPPPRITRVNNVSGVPWGWAPPREVEKAWDAIIIHHSATSYGNVVIIDKWHRDNGWDGVGYDFVIGNGTSSRDGQIEVTYRWRRQLVGAHTKTPNNWGNEDTIGICLIGDFTKSRHSWKQFDSLTKLVRFLQQHYRIPTSRIYGHKNCPGALVTECPGNFPVWSFKSQL